MAKFTSAAMARRYARSRPPLHAKIIERIGVHGAAVLDVGCGAGLSTGPLVGRAKRVFGIDPAVEMLRQAKHVAPRAKFVNASVERLPFRDGAFDFLTAAGSLNYADPAASFPELRRVLAPGGTLCVYDFDHEDFPYERAPDGAIPLSPEILAEAARGFRVERSERLHMRIVMTMEQYLDYLLTETDIVPALEPWKPGATTEMFFSGYIAWLEPR